MIATAPRSRPWAAVLAAGVVCVFFALLAVYAVGELRGMAAELRSMDGRLSAVAATLGGMRGALATTNGALGRTNGLLVRTNGSIASMQADIRALSAIRGDIHEMSHKLAGSFLFRGVK